MEEDKKRLENLIKEFKTYGDLDGIQDLSTYVQSIENLIKEYQNSIEIEQEHKKENGELRERVKELEYKYNRALSDLVQAEHKNKELEEERQLVGMPVKNKRDGKIGIVLHKWESGSIAVLEKIYPRIINTHDSWDTLEIITDEVEQSKTKK